MPAKDNIRKMFDNIAPDYDKLNHIMSLGVDKIWRRKALKYAITPDSRQAFLDIACGTGDFAIAIAQKAEASSRIIGVDLSEGMLEVMRTKVAKMRLEEQISCEQGDCSQMRFEDNSFDCATIAFGIRNFEDRPKALKEILRVLKGNGKLVILELSVPSNPIILAIYKLYFLHVMPFIGGMISGDKAAYKYLPASVLKFPSPTEWIQVMKDAGYMDIIHKPLSLGLCRLYVGTKSQE